MLLISTLPILAVLCQFLPGSDSMSLHELAHDEWEAFKVLHGKTYGNHVEEQFRKKIYLNNRKKIAVHNKLADQPFQLSINKFGDILPHEFVNIHNGLKVPKNRTLLRMGVGSFLPPANVQVPDAVDWREKGYVTPVKNQGQCGSCWAFSSTGALEGQVFRKTGKLVQLSEQNLVDCSREFENNGCEGGLPDNAFNYIRSNGGIDTENAYPYEGQDDTCRYKKAEKGGSDTGFMDVKSGDEEMLKIAVATIGPISVGIDASHESLQFYSQGIYHEEKCSTTELDHAVLVVGYGTENGEDYWIVKNSWSAEWGEKGYIRMARNKNNHCGIATRQLSNGMRS